MRSRLPVLFVLAGCGAARQTLPASFPSPGQAPAWTAYLVDAEGPHLLDLSVEAERSAFRAACERHVGSVEACDLRRVVAPTPEVRGWPEGAWFRHEPWLVLVPEGARPEQLRPRYPLDNPVHTAVTLEGAAQLYVYFEGVMLPDSVIAAMFVDPWGRGVVAQGAYGTWTACGGG